MYRTFHLKRADYTFFASAHGTFSRIDHILGHKSNPGKFKKIEIISSIFSVHNAMRLEINYRKKIVKTTNTWRLNSVLLNNQEITEEVKEHILKIHRNKWQWKHNDPNPIGRSKNSSKGEVYSISISPQNTRKISNNLTLHLKQLEKEEQRKPKVSKRKEIIKIRAEINEIEMKKTIEKINRSEERRVGKECRSRWSPYH